MGIFDTFSPIEYIPRKVKFLLFILLIALISPFINSLLLAGKGTIVCDSQKDAYVITGVDYNDLATNNVLDAYLDLAPDFSLQRQKIAWLQHKIERQRYLLSSEATSLGVRLPLAFKKVGSVGGSECVRCSLGNYTNCYDSATETWADMELIPAEEFSIFQQITFYDNCRPVLVDSS
ncbi:hypothetical protein GQ473_07150, partial [archaeon]|nr:hypothetical protein [archaeon]